MPEVDLDVLQVGVQAGLSDRFVNDVKFTTERMPDMQLRFINSYMDMPGQRFDPVVIKYPSDWWQAFKERWLPRLAARWFPVRYTTTTFSPNIYYPQVKLPEEEHFLNVYRYDFDG